MKASNSRYSKGFSLVELMVVLAIIGILTALATPSIKTFLMEGKAPEIAKVAQGVIVKARAARTTGDTWASAADTELVKVVNADSRVTVQGSGGSASVLHGLGDGGTISFAPGTISNANDAGQLTFTNVHEAACASLANAMGTFVEVMTVNGTSAKALGGKYLGSAAQTACIAGETNTLVFLFR